MAQDIYLKRIPTLGKSFDEVITIHRSLENLATNDMKMLSRLYDADVCEKLRTFGQPDLLEWKTLAELLGYWANDVALNTWFNNHLSEKEGNIHQLSKTTLDDLLDTMKRVLERRDPAYAAEHLPETVPFNFNGRKPYDLNYFSDLRDSHIQLLSACIRTDFETDYVFVERHG